jgi:hypothetical protein
VASVGRLCRIAKRGAHAALTGTDGAGDALAADNLDTGLARVQVIDMTLAVTFPAGLLNAGSPRLACWRGAIIGAVALDTPESEPGPDREERATPIGYRLIGRARGAATLAKIR